MDALIITLLREGGMVHYTSQLANSICEKVDLTLIIPEGTDQKYFKSNINIKTVNTPNIGKWYSLKNFNILNLFQKIIEIQPDVIHISGSHYWILALYFFIKLKKYPVIITLHDIDPHLGEKSIVNNITNYFYLKIADKVFVHGKQLKKDLLIKGLDDNKISIIPHGDYSFFTKCSENNIIENGSILFFGRIEDYKGLEYLLKAIKFVKKDYNDVKVVIAGRGDIEKYKDLLHIHKENIEIINRYIYDNEVSDLFQKASIVVLPYVEASQSGIVPIAYAFKKPVVVTNVGSIPEVVDDGKTGFIVPAKNSKDLANAILKIMHDEKLKREMGLNGYNKMLNELSWDKISVDLVKTYIELSEEND